MTMCLVSIAWAWDVNKLRTIHFFVSCNELPTLIDVDVSSDYGKKVAHSLAGSAGVSAVDALQWQDLLLKHGGASQRLREAIA